MSQDHDAHGRRIRFSVFYPELPPSSNKLYFRGTRLTKISREYKERFRSFVAQNHLHEVNELLDPSVDPTVIYFLRLTFYLDCLNETWGDFNLPPSRRAKDRYKRIDLSNRIKLLEDCVKTALDIDDSLTFGSSQAKFHSLTYQGVFVELMVTEPSTYGIPPLGGVIP